ncbi:MAG: IS630 family transposase [Planctomycetes bacterium]|nr:IS630 family transposase [Planctomycetota bacterium]
MRSKGTAAELEARRRLAVERVGEGWSQKDVAAFLGVHPVTVAKWVARHRADGADGLSAKPTPGRPRFLTADQEREVLGWRTDPPTKHGFDTDLWTARRVAELIRQKFGVRFHPNYLREWLSTRNFTPQKPARRVRQRDPVAIDRWLKEDWPRIQKRRARSARTSS